MKTSLKLKITITYNAIKQVLRRPAYALLAVFSSFLMIGITIWSLNIGLIWYILFQAPLSFFEKIEFFIYGYQGLFSSLNSILSYGIVVFSVMFGLNVAVLTYVIRRRGFRSVPKASGGGAFVFAVLGGGCVACGTSLLTPILLFFGIVSIPLLHNIGSILTWAGSMLIVYSLYKLSLLIPVPEKMKHGGLN